MAETSTGDSEIRHGTKIGRFTVVGELGSGGMGVVYAGHDRELDRQVALKVLRNAATTDEDRMRMLREGQAMARITHPNVITVFEVGTEGTLVFLAQELLDGGTLGQWLERPHTQAEILDKLVAAGRGLAAAHAAGLVHRDFKPDNVLLGKDGRVRVADFGLARALGAVGEQLAATRPNRTRDHAGAGHAPDPMSALTRTGTVMGTPLFMAPEQHDGLRADERSDQFSFCVALYNALFKDWPFDGKTSVALADAVIGGRRKPLPRSHDVPSRIRKIIDRGLATKPEDRYPSMDALLAELTAPSSSSAKKALVFAGIGAAVVGVAIAGAVVLSSRSSSTSPVDAAVAINPIDATKAVDVSSDELLAAIQSGRFDVAITKYSELAKQADPIQRSIALSTASLVFVLRGSLDDAEKRLREADTGKGTDPLANAHADLASAAIASMTGQLAEAIDRGARCSRGFEKQPVLAGMCQRIVGDAHAEQNDVPKARAAYEAAIKLDESSTAALALLTLDLYAGQNEAIADEIIKKAPDRQALYTDQNDLGGVAEARVLLARAHIAKGDLALAHGILKDVKQDGMSFRTRIEHQIALAHAQTVDEVDDGLAKLDAARKAAQKQGAIGLALAAQLARVEVLIAKSSENAATEQASLVEDARERGFERIAKLAESASH